MSDLFGDRMKKYETVTDFKLPIKLPIILRLDGNSFSNFTKQMGFKKPFDEQFTAAMWEATKAVLKYCSGAQVAYVQSDEITVLLRNDQTPDTDAFLANRLEKICSLVASTASVKFCNYLNQWRLQQAIVTTTGESNNSSYLENGYPEPIEAAFDLRVFVVPPSEVNNAFLWRQQDAFKNCVSSVAWYGLGEKFGKKTAQKMLHKLSTNERQEIIFKELGMNMNDYPTKYKRGVCICRENVEVPIESVLDAEKIAKFGKAGQMVTRTNFVVDENIPLFNQNTNYINKFLD